jgi:hypothetical protein
MVGRAAVVSGGSNASGTGRVAFRFAALRATTGSAFFVVFFAGRRAAFFATFPASLSTDFFADFFAAALVGLAFAADLAGLAFAADLVGLAFAADLVGLAFAAARAGFAFAAAGFPAVFFFVRVTFLATFARDAVFFFADAARVVFRVAFFLAITRPLRSPRPRTRVAQAH